jgi:hypothetical protein
VEFFRHRNGANLWYLPEQPKLIRSAGWLVARVLGLAREGNWTTTDFAFDVLSLQALFLVSIPPGMSF